jgi:hypothetical protein
MMECTKNCEFLKFKYWEFFCDFYNKKLPIQIKGKGLVSPIRCKDCEDNESNSHKETIDDIKQQLEYLKDSLYDCEDTIKSIYNIIGDN